MCFGSCWGLILEVALSWQPLELPPDQWASVIVEGMVVLGRMLCKRRPRTCGQMIHQRNGDCPQESLFLPQLAPSPFFFFVSLFFLLLLIDELKMGHHSIKQNLVSNLICLEHTLLDFRVRLVIRIIAEP